MSDLEITTGWLDQTEIPEVIRLREAVSDKNETIRKYRTPEFYIWKYYNNPLGKSWVRVARCESHVVGMLTASPREVWAKSRKLLAAELSDGFVHPNYQRRGIFTRLGNELFRSLDDRGVELTYGLPNDKALPGERKMGFEIATHIQTYRRPISPKVLESMKPVSVFHTSLRPVMARLFFYFWPKLRLRSNICPVENISHIVDRMDVPNDNTSFKVYYEHAYAKWRYQDFPSQVQLLEYRNSNTAKVMGWIAVCVMDGPGDSSPIANILNVSSFTQDISIYLNLICGALQTGLDQGATSATLVIPSPVSPRNNLLFHAMRKLGFIKRGSRKYFIIRLSPTTSLTWAEVSHPGTWMFGLGDTDGL